MIQGIGVPVTHVDDLDSVPVSWIRLSSALAIRNIQGIKLVGSLLSVCISSPLSLSLLSLKRKHVEEADNKRRKQSKIISSYLTDILEGKNSRFKSQLYHLLAMLWDFGELFKLPELICVHLVIE